MNRVLVITNNSLRRSNANGLLLLDQLSSFKYEEIITYSIDNALPDKDTGIAHFKTTDNEHLKYFLSKKKLGRVVLNGELTVSRSTPTNVGKHKGIKESDFFLFIREFIWKHNHKERDNLDKFISEYHPSVILFQASRTIFMIDTVIYLASKYHLPVVVYTGEDEYFHTYPIYRIFKNILQRRMKKRYKALIHYVKRFTCTQAKLASLYQEEFNINTNYIYPSITLDELKVRDVVATLKITNNAGLTFTIFGA